jgi:two-component system, OmpR family, sensor histidine kinase KdpD
VSARAAEGGVRITVTDHGPGVPPDESERVFEKFHRAPLADSPAGTGLGLSISRGIIEAHGGRIWIEPGSEGGAAVVMALPEAPTDGGGTDG